MNFLIQLLIFLVCVAIFYGVLYLFQKYVFPIDQKLLSIIIFIFAALLLIYALTGHSLLFWR